MNPVQLLLILRARWKLAISVAVLVTAAVIAGSQWVPKRYTAETSVMVDVRSPDPIAAVLMPATLIPGSLGTQADIIRSERVARKVVKMLQLETSPALKEQWRIATEGKGSFETWIAKLLQRGLIVTPSRESNLMTISYQAGDPTFTATVANAYAQAYIEAAIELKVEPARQYARWFGDQAKGLRENVEKAQARLSEYQQEKGIVSSDETLDYELAKLNDLSARLTAAQGETRDAQSKVRSAGGSTDTLPEVMQNPVVAGLRADIAKQEIRLKEAAGNIGLKHPQYLRMESELAEMKSRLIAETRHAASVYSASSEVGKTREAELKAAIEAQKKKLLLLKNQRDEIAVLVREVETSKRAYEAVTNRFNQTSLESQATQTNVSVLTPAVEPLEPSFPKPLAQMAMIAVILGIALGGAAAFGLEMLDRRIRSVDDLAELLQLPVLGAFEPDRVRARLPFLRASPALLPKA